MRLPGGSAAGNWATTGCVLGVLVYPFSALSPVPFFFDSFVAFNGRNAYMLRRVVLWSVCFLFFLLSDSCLLFPVLGFTEGVVVRCGLPYAAMVTEFTGDGTPVYGVELDLPCVGPVRRCRSFFF